MTIKSLLNVLKGNARDAQQQSPIRDRELAVNLSFVLHEPSDSATVLRAMNASRVHERTHQTPRSAAVVPATKNPASTANVDLWLTASVGVPTLLPEALAVSPERLHAVDSDTSDLQPVPFFGALAQLSLPLSSPQQIGVAALVVRPDRSTTHLEMRGPFDWPEEQDAVLRAIEQIIQAYVGQWIPRRQLWVSPAEEWLSDEVY